MPPQRTANQRRAAEEDELDRRMEDISYDEANPIFDIYSDEDQEEVAEFVFDDQGKPTFVVNKSLLNDIGAWADIGFRSSMEYVYVCVDNFAHDYGFENLSGGLNVFYGVFDGHGGKHAVDFAYCRLLRIILEDKDFLHEDHAADFIFGLLGRI
ncbi:hypothetical protein CRG98_047629 [Punica granatum]|uniref:Uncharacterized protein n=1 Tax=Punica granatum TaxID=22663 RepID=A0A2I0HK66_PUNGR|nr:hypothetical protein CRG98_047629 [Punica granatum]